MPSSAKLPGVSYACTIDTRYNCENPGTFDSQCISEGGASCTPCQSGCQDGKCISGETQTPTCTDSDGVNYYLKGYTESYGMKDYDNCRVINSNTDYYNTNECNGENCYVLEFSCTPSLTPYSHVWKCPSACKDGACVKGEESKEQVKCMFTDTESMQKCYGGDGRFGCAGIGSCIAVVYGDQGTKLTWKSSCGGYAYTVIDGNNEYAEFTCEQTPTQTVPVPGTPIEEVQEQVKCLFVNSASQQKCTAGKPGFECEGIGSCVVDVHGPRGEKLVWKSSCGGYAYTVMDGNNEPAEFKCESTATPTPTREQVQCVFLDSKVLQYPHSATEECYTDDQRFGCKWDGNVVEEYIDGKPFRYAHCIVEVPGNYGEKLTWKSSCGGYAYTVIDGNTEKAEFQCIPETNVTMDRIIGKGFKKAYWQCYDGTEQNPVTGVSMQCWTAEYWQEHAKNACMDNCRKFENPDITKCGANSLSVSGECYIGEEGTVFIPPEQVGEGGGKKIAMEPDANPGDVLLVYFYMKDCPYCEGMDEELDKVSKDLGINIMKMDANAEPELIKSYGIDGFPSLLLLEYTPNGIREYILAGKVDSAVIIEWIGKVKGSAIAVPEKPKEEMLICKDSCPLDGKCYPFGYRKGGKFCSDDGAFKEQWEGDEACENNFECESNVCVSGKCISSGLIQKILNWFKSLFGLE
jgi:thiol-disulfide isomerase/thioredoxin